MASDELYGWNPITQLLNPITTTTRPVTFTVTGAAGFPSGPQFHTIIDSEILLITQVSGTSWTGTNVEGTAAATHSAYAPVIGFLTTGAFQGLSINSSVAAGLSPTIPLGLVGANSNGVRLDGLPADHQHAGGWVQLGSTTLGSDAASVTFSSISGTFRHLVLQYYARASDAAASVFFGLRFNGDSGNNYYAQRLASNGASQDASTEANAGPTLLAALITANTGPANTFSSGFIWIPFYALQTNGTSNARGTICQSTDQFGTAANNRNVDELAGLWNSTAAITSITALSNSGGNLKAGSIFTLSGLL